MNTTAHLSPSALLSLVCFVALAGTARADTNAAAVIVELSGEAEVRPLTQGAGLATTWQTATLERPLLAGEAVRTGELSRMGLLFADQTQVRLHQRSLLEIKAVAATGEGTVLGLPLGRMWSHYQKEGARLAVETPAATAAIRGTAWELGVGPDGRTTLTVLSGRVELANDFGRVSVGAAEGAEAEVGKAPVKVLLANPEDRVQWVTAYAVEPRRYARGQDSLGGAAALIEEGRFAAAAARLEALLAPPGPAGPEPYLLRADLGVMFGDLAGADAWAERAAKRFPEDPRPATLRARIALAGGRFTEGRQLLAAVLARFPEEPEALVVLGDLERAEGRGEEAEAAYRRALTADPAAARAYFGLGVAASERERVRQARRNLERALALAPEGAGFRGELATLETNANRLTEARAEYSRALAEQPADPVARTGLGLLELKRGEEGAALEALLRATLLEPRYARAHLYLAVAWYRLGQRERALEALERASAQDPKDPLPHLLASLLATDAIEPGRAVAAARRAVALLPNLKSLNQLANNQKGSANLGSALALFGLEEWAEHLAQESYSPFWSGSHLFLADRSPGSFAKTSELFQGFLADPTVFGASNRFRSLVPEPGVYGTLTAAALFQGEIEADQEGLIINGFSNARFPAATFLNPERTRIDGFPLDATHRFNADVESLTAALGLEPVHAFSLFAFGNRTEFDAAFFESAEPRATPFASQAITIEQLELGTQWKLSPTSVLWLKLGRGDEDGRMAAPTDQEPEAFTFGIERQDIELRHTAALPRGHEVSWGAEWAESESPAELADSESVLRSNARDQSRLAYIGDRLALRPALLIEAQVTYLLFERRQEIRLFSTLGEEEIGLPPLELRRELVLPRLGLVARLGEGRLLRLAALRFLRPVSAGTLAPVAVAGVPIDERLLSAGGELEQLAAELDWTVSAHTFVTLAAERQRVRNPDFLAVPPPGLSLADLERLRSLAGLDTRNTSLLEGTPNIRRGELWEASLALNHIVNERWSLAGRLFTHDGETTTPELAGKALPFVPDWLGALETTWLPLPRFYLRGRAVYRSERFADRANLERLSAGWTADLNATWESRDKRFLVLASLSNLLSDASATAYGLRLELRR